MATLKINGARVIELTKIPPSPKIGQILLILLEEALDNADLNTVEYMENRAIELAKLDEKELKVLGEKAKARKEEVESGEIDKIRSKHHVK